MEGRARGNDGGTQSPRSLVAPSLVADPTVWSKRRVRAGAPSLGVRFIRRKGELPGGTLRTTQGEQRATERETQSQDSEQHSETLSPAWMEWLSEESKNDGSRAVPGAPTRAEPHLAGHGGLQPMLRT